MVLEERKQQQEMETEWREQEATLEEELRKALETNELLQEQLDELTVHRATEPALQQPGPTAPARTEHVGREVGPKADKTSIDWKARLDAEFAAKRS